MISKFPLPLFLLKHISSTVSFVGLSQDYTTSNIIVSLNPLASNLDRLVELKKIGDVSNYDMHVRGNPASLVTLPFGIEL